MRLLVVMDPIAGVNLKKDSTMAMLWAAQRRGYHLYYCLLSDLYLQEGNAMAVAAPLTVYENTASHFSLAPASTVALTQMDVVLMRTDPPFNMAYIYATYILERASHQGVLVVNDPASVRDCNEKLFATEFAGLMVPTIVASRMAVLREFIDQQQEVVVKPLDGMGGAGVFKLHATGDNVGATLEMLTQLEQLPIMAQRYIPAIRDGDKRILMVDGVPVDYCLARIPKDGETRGNLAAGGRGEARPLTTRDREIANTIGPVLRAKGLMFVGLDVIGDYVTEINVTSPTCIREIDQAYGLSIADMLLDAIEQRHASIQHNKGN